MRTKARAITFVFGLLTACSVYGQGQGFLPVVETATNFWGVGDILLMTEVQSEGVNAYLGDSWDVTVRFTAGGAMAVVGPMSFQHHGAGLEPSAIWVPDQPAITFIPFTEPQWFEFSRTGPAAGDSLTGIPDFVYKVSGIVAYDGRTWFSWHPTVELQVIPEAYSSALLAVGGLCWLLFRRRQWGKAAVSVPTISL